MLESLLDSDGEMGCELVVNSSSTSSSSSLSSSSTLSPSPSSEATSTTTPSRLSLSSTKPHLSSSDPLFSSLSARSLGPRDFTLIRRLGRGDIGTVFLCRLSDPLPECGPHNPLLFAMKVVDKREAEKKNKLFRAETEKRILRSLDHPFLPTLYADFDASPHYSCVVMEFCPGGDLHALRHRQPHKRFPLAAARFYAAEVLVALEYLHLLGVVYRDLKPENVLLRRDGHVMLSDFDLSLLSTSDPSLHSDPPPPPSCFPSRRLFPKRFFRRQRLVAEPVAARSGSFVGTHEYVSPEVAAGEAHGAAVDWWAFGVFLYELVYGRTPFAGKTNEETLRNIVKKPLLFPPNSITPPHHADPRVSDLISKLLVKDPSRRLGAAGGAAEVKGHPFFSGVNFALLRSHKPPFVPPPPPAKSNATGGRKKQDRFEYF